MKSYSPAQSCQYNKIKWSEKQQEYLFHKKKYSLFLLSCIIKIPPIKSSNCVTIPVGMRIEFQKDLKYSVGLFGEHFSEKNRPPIIVHKITRNIAFWLPRRSGSKIVICFNNAHHFRMLVGFNLMDIVFYALD